MFPTISNIDMFSYKKGKITQNLNTNCTKLVISLDEIEHRSYWSCQHGSNGEKSDQILVQKECKLLLPSFLRAIIGPYVFKTR